MARAPTVSRSALRFRFPRFLIFNDRVGGLGTRCAVETADAGWVCTYMYIYIYIQGYIYVWIQTYACKSKKKQSAYTHGRHAAIHGSCVTKAEHRRADACMLRQRGKAARRHTQLMYDKCGKPPCTFKYVATSFSPTTVQ